MKIFIENLYSTKVPNIIPDASFVGSYNIFLFIIIPSGRTDVLFFYGASCLILKLSFILDGKQNPIPARLLCLFTKPTK